MYLLRTHLGEALRLRRRCQCAIAAAQTAHSVKLAAAKAEGPLVTIRWIPALVGHEEWREDGRALGTSRRLAAQQLVHLGAVAGTHQPSS